MPIKQSRNHSNLPAQWQGKRPDYDQFAAPHNSLDQQRVNSLAFTQARNCQTINRLQSAWECRQHSFNKSKEIR